MKVEKKLLNMTQKSPIDKIPSNEATRQLTPKGTAPEASSGVGVNILAS